jgi:hypothetical protein
MLGVEEAYALMLGVCGAGIVVDALERIVSVRAYREDGLFSWTVLRQRLLVLPAPLRALADRMFSGAGPLMTILAIQIGAVGLVVGSRFGGTGYAVGLTTLVTTQLYVVVRMAGVGAIGADPMTLVVCGAAWLTTVIARGPVAAQAGLWFVAAQGCLGYVVAGVTKLASPSWRSGAAIAAVLSTYTYGHRRLHDLVRGRRWLSLFLCWSVMLWEATFPIVLVVPRYAAWPLLVLGVLFHLSIAGLMGLNLFLFAFPATYAAILAIRP